MRPKRSLLPDQPTLDQWLVYQQQLHPQDIELGLARVQQVAERLGLGPADCPRIVVAGTNGKGSSIAMLASIYSAAGYRVGCYTSPHITHYCERLQIDGAPVSEQTFCEAFGEIERLRGEVELTYFEFGTLAALLILAAENIDIQLLEVGLGGRLDAVNIVDSDVALITQIAIDHCDWLGNTRDLIGVEKAGIMRSGRPCVCADPALPPSMVNHAADIGAVLYRSGIDFDYSVDIELPNWTWRSVDTALQSLSRPGLKGDYQLQNGAAVLEVVRLLQNRLPVSTPQLMVGLEKVHLAGRFEVRGNNPQWVLDVAHNPQACAVLAENLASSEISGRRIAVLGMLEDKNISASIRPLLDLIDCWFLARIDQPRGATKEVLQQSLLGLGCQKQAVLCLSLVEAIRMAGEAAQQGDQIVVFGSFHTVAAAG